MTSLDYVVLAILAVSALIGILRGLIKEAMSLFVWVAAAWLAARFGEAGGALLAGTIDDPAFRLWAGRLLVFVVVLFAGSLLTWLVGYLVRRLPITGTDRGLGLLFGLARGVLLVALLVVALRLGGFDSEPWWQKSKLIPYAAAVTTVLEQAARAQLATTTSIRRRGLRPHLWPESGPGHCPGAWAADGLPSGEPASCAA